jgi:hypothetical protein
MTRTPGRSRLPSMLLLVAALVAAPSVLVAQADTIATMGDTLNMAPLPPSTAATREGLEAFVLGGGLAPLAQLSSDPGSFATQVSSAPIIGGTAGWWLANGFGGGVQVLYAPASLNIIPTSFQGPIPTDLGNARYLAATAEVRYRLLLKGPAGVLAPYVAVGAGIRHLNFDPIASLDVRDRTDPVATVAGGAEARLYGPVSMRLELRDYLSRFTAAVNGATHTQHDVAITFGLGILP